MNTTKQGTMNDAVAATLRAEIAAQRLQLKDVSEQSGIPDRTLSRYLKGERDISVNVLESLAKAVGLTTAQVWTKATERM